MKEDDRFKKASLLFYADCFSNCLNLSQWEQAESLEKEWEEQCPPCNPPVLWEECEPLPGADTTEQEMWERVSLGAEAAHSHTPSHAPAKIDPQEQDHCSGHSIVCQALGDRSAAQPGLPGVVETTVVWEWSLNRSCFEEHVLLRSQPEPTPWGWA